MVKLIGYARVSTRQQDTDRQEQDLLAAGVRRDDLYVDHGVSGARASRPAFDRALDALHDGDTLVVTTLDRLGRSTIDMLTSPRRSVIEVRGFACRTSVVATLTRQPRWGRWCSPSWRRSHRWNSRSSANGSATPSRSAVLPAKISAAACGVLGQSGPRCNQAPRCRRACIPGRSRSWHVPRDLVSPHPAAPTRRHEAKLEGRHGAKQLTVICRPERHIVCVSVDGHDNRCYVQRTRHPMSPLTDTETS